MTKQELINCINHGQEIEFCYHGKRYSLTYGNLDGKHVISFCEFYKETSEAEKIEDILAVKRNGVTVLEMLNSITENDIWIY